MPPSISRSRRKSQPREFLSQLFFPTYSNPAGPILQTLYTATLGTNYFTLSEFSAATVALPSMEHSQPELYVRIVFVLLSMLPEVYV